MILITYFPTGRAQVTRSSIFVPCASKGSTHDFLTRLPLSLLFRCTIALCFSSCSWTYPFCRPFPGEKSRTRLGFCFTYLSDGGWGACMLASCIVKFCSASLATLRELRNACVTECMVDALEVIPSCLQRAHGFIWCSLGLGKRDRSNKTIACQIFPRACSVVLGFKARAFPKIGLFLSLVPLLLVLFELPSTRPATFSSTTQTPRRIFELTSFNFLWYSHFFLRGYRSK